MTDTKERPPKEPDLSGSVYRVAEECNAMSMGPVPQSGTTGLVMYAYVVAVLCERRRFLE
jgi:hypothetical protein